MKRSTLWVHSKLNFSSPYSCLHGSKNQHRYSNVNRTQNLIAIFITPSVSRKKGQRGTQWKKRKRRNKQSELFISNSDTVIYDRKNKTRKKTLKTRKLHFPRSVQHGRALEEYEIKLIASHGGEIYLLPPIYLGRRGESRKTEKESTIRYS